MTSHAELFAALAAPFEDREVRTRAQAGRQFSYITARTAMNRLDTALGPENWWDEYIAGEHSTQCKLSIRLPDGTIVTKCDVGGGAGMQDSGDDEKSAFSDAFKRACAKFGVGRYLYGDGYPDFLAAGESGRVPVIGHEDHRAASPQIPQQRNGFSQPAAPIPHRPAESPKNGRALFAFLKDKPKRVFQDVSRWGQQNGLPERIVDWPEAAVTDCAAEFGW